MVEVENAKKHVRISLIECGKNIETINKMLRYLIYIRSYEIIFNNQTIYINYIFFNFPKAFFLQIIYKLVTTCKNTVLNFLIK